MCGIAGIMCLQRRKCDVNKTEAIVKNMTDIIAHRGPDGEGQMVIDEGHVFWDIDDWRSSIFRMQQNSPCRA